MSIGRAVEINPCGEGRDVQGQHRTRARRRNLGRRSEVPGACGGARRLSRSVARGARRLRRSFDDEARRRLASLGYVNAGAAPQSCGRMPLARPTWVPIHRMLEKASGLFVSEPVHGSDSAAGENSRGRSLQPRCRRSGWRQRIRRSDTRRRRWPGSGGRLRSRPRSPDVNLYVALHYARGPEWRRAVPMLGAHRRGDARSGWQRSRRWPSFVSGRGAAPTPSRCGRKSTRCGTPRERNWNTSARRRWRLARRRPPRTRSRRRGRSRGPRSSTISSLACSISHHGGCRMPEPSRPCPIRQPRLSDGALQTGPGERVAPRTGPASAYRGRPPARGCDHRSVDRLRAAIPTISTCYVSRATCYVLRATCHVLCAVIARRT